MPFLTFLKLGAVVYDSGYTLLAFLRADLVQNLHWLTDKQLLDAVSIGQFTPSWPCKASHETASAVHTDDRPKEKAVGEVSGSFAILSFSLSSCRK